MASTEPTTQPIEPSPYLGGSYTPVDTEITAHRLEVTGEIPEDLRGIFVRNSSNPKFTPVGRYHWFDGDGMLHAVQIEDGGATYRNRYVRTDGLAAEEKAGRSLWTGIMERPDLRKPGGPYKDTANTDVVFHAGQLLALWWLSGRACVIKLPDLETIGVQTYGGKLERTISAHPTVDPRTGEMMFFDYAPFPPYLIYGVISADGKLVHQVPIDLPGPRLQHDIAITQRFSILFDMSLMWDPELLAQGRTRIRFFRDKPTRFGIIPRFGTNEQVRWFEGAPCFMYHTINAWEDGDEVVLIGCKIDHPLAGDPDNPQHETSAPAIGLLRIAPHLHRWRFNLRTGTTTEEPLDDVLTEFPRMNDGGLGRPSRYSYNGRLAAGPDLQFDRLMKYDMGTGASTGYDYPSGWHGGEVSFVSAAGASAEDDGYLLTFVAERASERSELQIFDARRLEPGPIARIRIPQRVPTGYHTRWVSAEELANQRPL
jgi:carotenoid cleavage dioxygenase-like enzyme